MKPIALRMDDVGSASKQYCGRKMWPFNDYRELEVVEINQIGNILCDRKAKLTVGVTACWIELDGSYTPFCERFPAQAGEWKQLWDEGLVEIANHGLTHCVPGKHRRRWLRSNRKYWREFHHFVSPEARKARLIYAQEILGSWIRCMPTTFIPPGNVFTENEVGYVYGFSHICNDRIPCNLKHSSGITFVGSESMLAFHDKDIILNGVGWLESHIMRLHNEGRKFVFAREICA